MEGLIYTFWMLGIICASISTVYAFGALSLKISIFDDQVEAAQEDTKISTGRGYYLAGCAIGSALVRVATIASGVWMATILVQWWPFV